MNSQGLRCVPAPAASCQAPEITGKRPPRRAQNAPYCRAGQLHSCLAGRSRHSVKYYAVVCTLRGRLCMR
jgi:hypothetical protein